MDLRTESVFASLVGSAVGDALGLPYENLSARRAARLLGPPDRLRLAGGRGMVSDDAEHACMTAAAIATGGDDVGCFARDLARRLRWWIATAPPGVGLATLKSTLRLWAGVSPARSGVRSAGNGPAMRAAVLGRLVTADALFDFVHASTRITHRDDRATLGAYAVALASGSFARDSRPTIDGVLDAIRDTSSRGLDPAPLLDPLEACARSLRAGETTPSFAASICRRPGRVSGYILETVPVALHAAFASTDAFGAIAAAIRCGGDTDTVGSIAGGIVGLRDSTWIAKLIEWPCDERWLRSLATAARERTRPPRFPVFRRVPRNALLLAIVLAHVGRRTMPPY